jgi:indole-3-glycerol phosphate synthase
MEPETKSTPKVNRSARGEPDILRRIVRTKQMEIAALLPRLSSLRAAAEALPPCRRFAASLRAGASVALIGEFKRRSPSAGPLGGQAGPAASAAAYQEAGASALSVLTDEEYFGGTLEDLRQARSVSALPVLRKDFVLDPVQVYEARAAGADAVLLIARILDDAQLADLLQLVREVGLDALVEVHNEEELARAIARGVDLVGVNNRDLATFRTDLGLSVRLAPFVPAGMTLVAESGIRTSADVDRLAEAGVDAILVGETLMRAGTEGARAAGLAGRPRRTRLGAGAST